MTGGHSRVHRARVKPHWRHLVALLDRHRVDVVLDIGANIGQYACHLRHAGWSGRIVSFEPQSRVHAQLSAAAADDPDWRIAAPMALGARAGEAVINLSNESDMSSLLEMRADFLATSPTSRRVGRETIRVETLDAVFDDHVGAGARAFVKIDTQGYEAAVLDGAATVLPRLAGLQLELSLVPLYEGEVTYRALMARLAASGFALHLVIPGYFSRHRVRMLQFDGIFFR